jgi:hypothetical protein
MIRLRFAVLATLVAAAFAGSLTYFVMPLARVDADQRGRAQEMLQERLRKIPVIDSGHSE